MNTSLDQPSDQPCYLHRVRDKVGAGSELVGELWGLASRSEVQGVECEEVRASA